MTIININSIGRSINGSSSTASWAGMLATVINQPDTIAAAANSMMTLVVFAEATRT